MRIREGGVRKLRRLRAVLKAAGLGAVATVIFMAGVGFGSGWISFASAPVSANKDLPADLDYSSVEKVYDRLRTSYDGALDLATLMDGLKSGLVSAAGDPYTQYLSSEDAKKFNDELNGSFTGIGAQLGQDENNNIIIVAPIEGFPASKAGLRPQDIIISIDGTSTTGMSIDKAVSNIRGPKDTAVQLRILRNNSEDLTFDIVRDDIKIASVTWKMLPGSIGYIDVSQFGEDTTPLMTQAAAELTAKGAKKILLDLRGNPGGLLDAAEKMAQMWLTKGKVIVQEKRGGVVTSTSVSSGGGAFIGMPTVVLINAGSASASEIVAGALKDNGAATLVGEKSFGKGSVQQIEDLFDGSEVKITVARWYRPNGQNIDKKGIEPDTLVELTEDDYYHQRDPQNDAALELLRSM